MKLLKQIVIIAISIFPYIVITIGIIGFVFGIFASSKESEYKDELPLGEIEGLVVDSSDNIYVGLGFYEKIQVYDKDGNFIRNWSIDCMNGSFSIRLTKEQNIEVLVSRSNKRIIFNGHGEILKYYEAVYEGLNINSKTYIKETGEKYEVRGIFFTQIEKVYPSRNVIVRQNKLFQLFKAPQCLILIALSALFFAIKFRKVFT